MPLYGYRCQSCEREFEVLQRMSDPPQAACPDCGGAGTRLFYPAGIVFKGSGFYKTDSRSTAPASANGSTAPAEKPADKASDGGTAGKPAPAAKPAAAAPAPATTPTTATPKD